LICLFGAVAVRAQDQKFHRDPGRARFEARMSAVMPVISGANATDDYFRCLDSFASRHKVNAQLNRRDTGPY
jgi:hypothetical protein